MKNKYLTIALLASGLLAGCINDDDYKVPDLKCTETTLIENMEPEDIPASEIVQQYSGDGIIEAYVVSSDEAGQFFKSISFQSLDGSFAFSVPVDVESYFINFEPGRKVLLKLNGTYTQIYNDALRIGTVAISEFGNAYVGMLPSNGYTNVLNRSCIVVPEDGLVQQATLAELKSDSFINKLVEVSDVQFSNGSLGSTFYDEENDTGGGTNHHLTDVSGQTIIFRTSSFASFGGEVLPEKSGKVRGILTKFGEDYQIIVRTKEDIMLMEPRFN